MIELVSTIDDRLQSKGSNPLFEATRFAHNEIVEILLNNGANPNIEVKNESPLFFACKRNNIKAVELLLFKGANVNTTYNGWSALFVASEYGHFEIAALLLSYGANPNEKCHDTPIICIAIAKNQTQIVKILLEHGANSNTKYNEVPIIYRTADLGHNEILRLLIEHGADSNAKYKETPVLYRASALGQKEIVKILLENGAEVDSEYRGYTPLEISVINKNEECAKLLISHGANKDRPILKNERYEKNLKYYIAKLQNKDDNLDKNIESGQKVYDKLKIECGKPIFKEKLEKSEAAIIEEAYYAICKENKNKFAVSLAPGKNQVIKSMGHGFRLLSQGNVEIATQHGDCNDNKLNIILVSDQGVNVINSAFYNNCKFDIIYEAWIKIDELYFYKKENVNQNEGGQILFRFKEYFPSTFNYRISIHQNN